MAAELTLARSGALDTDLLSQQPFYGTNFTKPLLFIEDGAYFVSKATAMGLTGSQWGVMNETGSFPGQPWLWLYTLWYQVPGWTNSANIDMIAIYMTGLATILLLLIPFIPGLRDIPRLIPVHRLIWRHRDGPPPGSGVATSPASTNSPGQSRSGGSTIRDRPGLRCSQPAAPARAGGPGPGAPLLRRIVPIQGAPLEVVRCLVAVGAAFFDDLRTRPAIVVPGGARRAAPVRVQRTPYQQRQQQPQHAREQHDETHYMHVDAVRLRRRHGVTQDGSEGDQRDAGTGAHHPPAHWLNRPARPAHRPAPSAGMHVPLPATPADLPSTALRMVI